MTIRNFENSSTIDSASLEMLELSADDLDKVAGGAPTRHIRFYTPLIVTPQQQQPGGGMNLSL